VKPLVSSRATRAVIGSVLFFVVTVVVLAALLVRDNYRTALANSEGQALRFVAGAWTTCWACPACSRTGLTARWPAA
jgi:hypothetical protein